MIKSGLSNGELFLLFLPVLFFANLLLWSPAISATLDGSIIAAFDITPHLVVIPLAFTAASIFVIVGFTKNDRVNPFLLLTAHIVIGVTAFLSIDVVISGILGEFYGLLSTGGLILSAASFCLAISHKNDSHGETGDSQKE